MTENVKQHPEYLRRDQVQRLFAPNEFEEGNPQIPGVDVDTLARTPIKLYPYADFESQRSCSRAMGVFIRTCDPQDWENALLTCNNGHTQFQLASTLCRYGKLDSIAHLLSKIAFQYKEPTADLVDNLCRIWIENGYVAPVLEIVNLRIQEGDRNSPIGSRRLEVVHIAAFMLIKYGYEDLVTSALMNRTGDVFCKDLAVAIAFHNCQKYNVLFKILLNEKMSFQTCFFAAAVLADNRPVETRKFYASCESLNSNAINALAESLVVKELNDTDQSEKGLFFQQMGIRFVRNEFPCKQKFKALVKFALAGDKNREFGVSYLTSLDSPAHMLHNLSSTSESILPLFKHILPENKMQESKDRLHDFLLKINEEPFRLARNKKKKQFRFDKLFFQFDSVLWGEVRNFLKPDRISFKTQTMSELLLNPSLVRDLQRPLLNTLEQDELFEVINTECSVHEFELLERYFLDGATLRELAEERRLHHSQIHRALKRLVNRLRHACDPTR